MSPNYIVFAIPVFFLSMAVEFWYGRRKGAGWYNFEDTITNLNLGIGSQATGILTKLLVLGAYDAVYTQFRFFSLPGSWWAWLAAFVLFDYIYYWAHRLGHEWNYMWGAHIVHHQSEQFNLSVALRQSWIHNLLSFFMFLPLALLGVPLYMLVLIGAFTTLFQYWIHTRAIRRMPRWFEFVFNTPSHHRVHHATNPQYLDKNYAATFILWDRLHGSFCEEKEEPVYGITKPLHSLNPVWANLHFYPELWKGIRREKGLLRKLLLPFRGPAYLGSLLPPEAPAEKRNPSQAPLFMKTYVFIQFVILTAALIKYLIHFEELSNFYRLAGFALIVLTTHICAGLLEGRRAAVFSEAVRLVCVVLMLNALYYTQYRDWFVIMLIGSLFLSVSFGLALLLNVLRSSPARRARL